MTSTRSIRGTISKGNTEETSPEHVTTHSLDEPSIHAPTEGCKDVADFKTPVMAAIRLAGSSGNVIIHTSGSNSAVKPDESIVQAFYNSSTGEWSGLSAENALHVKTIRPEYPSANLMPFSRYFTACNSEFFSSMSSVKLENDYLTFSDGIPFSTNQKKLYVRSSIQVIADNIINIEKGKQRHDIVFGAPGVGKSFFLLYLLWRLLQNKGQRVLYIYKSRRWYYDGQGNFFMFDKLPPNVYHDFWTKDLWCLFDTKTQDNITKVPLTLCSFILATTIRSVLYNDFKKEEPEPLWNFLPYWTEDEMQNIATTCFPNCKETWRPRFEILGGVPLYVFMYVNEDPEDIVSVLCRQCKLSELIRPIGPHSTFHEESQSIHLLIHMNSNAPYNDYHLEYASEAALEILVRTRGYEIREKMELLLAGGNKNPLVNILCGYVFKHHAINMLKDGGKFTCRKLVDENTRTKPPDFALKIPSCNTVHTMSGQVHQNQYLGELYLSLTKSDSDLDTWIPGVGGFKITVDISQGLKSFIGKELSYLGDSGRKLYWLLPPLYNDSFNKKEPFSIDQYAVRIPYPDPMKYHAAMIQKNVSF
ncbi:hypothetical protein MP638_006868 [Amoeboaphelidium occidentale]|nr:hypothetical protein MP638_006868 [Amoeboaphelidium occidentale]